MDEAESEISASSNAPTRSTVRPGRHGAGQLAGEGERDSEAEPVRARKLKSARRPASAAKAASSVERRRRRRSGEEADFDEEPRRDGAAGPPEENAESFLSTAGRALWRHRDFVLSLLLLLATIWLGWSANDIVRAQTRVTESIGREQNQTALMQGFISAIQGAGLESEREQRMLEASIALYLELAKDRRYTKLSASIPVPTDPQLQEILKGKGKSDRDAILQLYGRASDIALVPTTGRGIFHIAIATFESRSRAIEFAKTLERQLRPRTSQPVYVIRNQRGLYLILMGGFNSSEEASRKSEELGLAKQFQGVYVTQWRDWVEICGSAGGGLACAAENR